MQRDLSGVVIDEVSDAMVGNAAQFGPRPERANRRLLPLGKNTARSQSYDVGELAGKMGFGW